MEPAKLTNPALAAASAAPAPAPAAVLIMVEGGQYRELAGVATDAVLEMRVTALLNALQQDGIFAKALAGVMLDRCTVTVATSASEEAPSAAEEAASRALKGAVTLGRLAAGTLAADELAPAAAAAVAGGRPYYLYVRVCPQAPHRNVGAGGGGGGEQPLCESAQVRQGSGRPIGAPIPCPPRTRRARAHTHPAHTV